MTARKLALALASAVAASTPADAFAHWCDDLWVSNYNFVIRPVTDTVTVPSSGSATLDIYIQNNMGYPLKDFVLSADAANYFVTVARTPPKYQGFLMPGEKLKHTLTISPKASGGSLSVTDLQFGVKFGDADQGGVGKGVYPSHAYPSGDGKIAMIRKADGSLAPAKPIPGITTASRPSDGNSQSAHLLFSSQADYDDLDRALDGLMKQYCVGRGGWDHGNFTGPTTGLCPNPRDSSTYKCSAAPTDFSGSKFDWQRLWSAQELAYRKASLGTRLPALREGLKCGWNDPNPGFKYFAAFVLGYLGEDAGARDFLKGIIDSGTSSAQEKAVAKASLLLMRNAGDAAYHADVATCASDANTYVAAVCEAALGIVDANDTVVSSQLIPRAKWQEPSGSDNGAGFVASHLLALVAWDRRGWAANAGDTGKVCFYENCGTDTTPPAAPGTIACSASEGGAIRVTWPQVTSDRNGNPETGVSYRVYYGNSPRPGNAQTPNDFPYSHVDATSGLYRDYASMDGTKVFYFAVVAVDAAGNVSNYSNEVSCTPRYKPVPQLSCSPTSGTAPLSVSCSASGSTDANGAADIASYTFALDGAQAQSGTSATYSTSLGSGSHTVQVTVADKGGLSSQASQAITVTNPANAPPTAKATATPTSGTAPLTVAFSSAGSADPEGTALTYLWDFGDSASSTSANPSHVYTSAGTYSAKLTVTDSGTPNLSAVASVTVTVSAPVNHPPDLSTASASPVNGNAPLAVHFDSTGVTDPDGNAFTVRWNFGDGSAASTARSVDHTYATAGSYTATLTVQDSGTPAIAAVTKNFAITATQPADTTAPAAPAGVACAASPLSAEGRLRVTWSAVSLDVSGNPESVASYVVSSGNQARTGETFTYPSSATTSATYFDTAASLDGARTYYFAVKAVDAAGNRSAYSAEVHCAPPYAPVARLTCSPASGTAPLAVTCSASASTDANGAADITSYAFTLDGAPVQSGTSASYSTTLASGGHTVQVTATDRGGLSSQASASITASDPANQSPTAKATATPTSGTAPLAVAFSSTGSSDPEGTTLTYLWDFGDGTATSSAANPSHTYASAGSYTARLTVTDSGTPKLSAVASATVAVAAPVNQPPDLSTASASPVNGAAPLAVHFDATGVTDPEGKAFTVSWSFGDGSAASTATSLDHTYAAAGTYTATLSVQDSGTPAIAAVTKSFTIVVSQPADVTPPAAPSNVACAASPLSSEGRLRVTWAAVTVDAAGKPESVASYVVFSGNQARTGESYAYPSSSGASGTYFDSAASLDGSKTYYFAVKAVDAAGNRSPYSAEVHCAPPYAPVAKLSCTPVSGSAPLSVACNAAASTDANGAADLASYAFLLDGAPAQSGTSPSFSTTLAAGGHTVEVAVADRGGLSSRASQSITVSSASNQPPTAKARAQPTSGAAPLTVAFSSTDSADPEGTALRFLWDFGDGTATSSEASPSHTFQAAGTYGVRLTVTDSASAPLSGIATLTISVGAAGHNPPDLSTAQATPSGGEAPLAVHFDATGVTDPDPFTVTWQFGDGTPDATGPSVDHTYANPGTFTATLTVQDQGSPSIPAVTRKFTVTVREPGGANHAPDCSAATVTPLSGVAPLTVVLDASGCTDPDGDSLTFSWQVPEPWSASEKTFNTARAEFVFPTSGEFDVTLRATDTAASPLEITRTFKVQVLSPGGSPDAGPNFGNPFAVSCSAGGGGLALAAALGLLPALRRRRLTRSAR